MPDRHDLYGDQGATFRDFIALYDDIDGMIHLAEGDTLIMGIRPHYSDTCIIERTWTIEDEVDNVYPIHITPEEMDIEPDEYKYDVSLQTADGDFYKIIRESSFTVFGSTTKKRVISGGE